MTWLIPIAAYLWGFVLLASFAGLGGVVGRGLGDRPSLGAGARAIARGIAATIVLGGVLNLTRLVSPVSVVGLVVGGVVAWVAQGGPRRAIRAAQRLHPADAVTIAALLMVYTNWFCLNGPPETPQIAHRIACIDDSAYTLFPERMLGIGHLGADPFNDRVTGSGLGGQVFLQTLVLALFPIEYIRLVDPGVAYLALGVWLLGSRLKPWTRALLGLLAAVTPTFSINASSVTMPAVLLIAVVGELERTRRGGTLRSVAAVALPLGGLLSLKSNLVPGGALLIFLWGMTLALLTRRARPILAGTAIGVLALALLAPWMIASFRACGSLLYPFLGEGYRVHTLVAIPHLELRRSSAESLAALLRATRSPTSMLMLGGLSLAAVGLMARLPSPRRLAAAVACLGTALACMGLFAVVFQGSFWRYMYPYQLAATLLAFATANRYLPRWEGMRGRAARYAVSAVPMIAILVFLPRGVRDSTDLDDSLVRAFAGRPRFEPREVAEHRRLQEAVPPGEPIFCVLDWPVMLDVARNPILYHDNVGAVSPPPGIPLREDPEDLATYLRDQGIRHVLAPSRDGLREYIRSREAELAEIWRVEPWTASYEENKVRLFDQLDAIADRYRTLAQDGRGMVIDLGAPATTYPRPATSVSLREKFEAGSGPSGE
jgi:hypothetical protein